MNNKIIALIVLLVVIIGGFIILRNDAAAPVDSETTEETEVLEEVVIEEETPATTVAPSVKEFTVTGTSFAFAPKTMTVKKGDTVRVTFINSEGMHDWKLDGYNVATKVLKVGERETIEFVASKSGSFEYYCSVGSHRAMGMVGTLTVE